MSRLLHDPVILFVAAARLRFSSLASRFLTSSWSRVPALIRNSMSSRGTHSDPSFVVSHGAFSSPRKVHPSCAGARHGSQHRPLGFQFAASFSSSSFLVASAAARGITLSSSEEPAFLNRSHSTKSYCQVLGTDRTWVIGVSLSLSRCHCLSVFLLDADMTNPEQGHVKTPDKQTGRTVTTQHCTVSDEREKESAETSH